MQVLISAEDRISTHNMCAIRQPITIDIHYLCRKSFMTSGSFNFNKIVIGLWVFRVIFVHESASFDYAVDGRDNGITWLLYRDIETIVFPFLAIRPNP